jgi:hypothetical protein
MVTRDAKEYPETISGEIQGGRPLHFRGYPYLNTVLGSVVPC